MKIIYGPKGTGKTKTIIELANKQLSSAKGYIVFITDNKDCSINLDIKVRFLDSSRFDVQGVEGFKGFINGVVASNGDIEYVFIDGVARITGKTLGETEAIFDTVQKLEKEFGVKFVITCSGAKEELPIFVRKFVD